MRVLVVGSNPSVQSESTIAFWQDTKSSKTLYMWLNLTDVEFELLTMVNVSDDTTPNNRPLKVAEIKAGLPKLQQTYEVGAFTKVIALGNTAADAMKRLGIECYKMPHPSGRNRQLNDDDFVAEKINGLKEYLKSV